MNKLSLNTKSLLIMGIINATPDSFSGDGIFKNNKFSLEYLKKILLLFE